MLAPGSIFIEPTVPTWLPGSLRTSSRTASTARRRGGERILAPVHWRCAGMIGEAGGGASPQADAHNSRDHSDGDLCFIQHRALLDVQLQVARDTAWRYFCGRYLGRVAAHAREPVAKLFSVFVLARRNIRRQNSRRCGGPK